jgi:GTPase involved in cell partitioning and DNA repair
VGRRRHEVHHCDVIAKEKLSGDILKILDKLFDRVWVCFPSDQESSESGKGNTSFGSEQKERPRQSSDEGEAGSEEGMLEEEIFCC